MRRSRPTLGLISWLFVICFATAAMVSLILFETDPERTMKLTVHFETPKQVMHED
jgi:hypothetical protein